MTPGPAGTGSSLPPVVRDTVWRIFAAGAAPGTRGSAFDNIEPAIRQHAPPADRRRAIATIRGWFDAATPGRRLRPDCARLVADLVLEGVGPRRSGDAVWAVGSLELGLSVQRIERRWSPGEIGSFVEAALMVLNGAEARAPVDGDAAPQGDPKGPGFRDAACRAGLVRAFARLEERTRALGTPRLHPTVGNLIDLVVELVPEQTPVLISRLEAPAMQARAARRAVARTPAGDPGAIVGWVAERAADAAVALAIVHTLSAVRWLHEGRGAPGEASSVGESARSGERREAEPLREPAAPLVRQLLERLAKLGPPDCLRWVGELLSQVSSTLSSPGERQKPGPLAQLEEGCTKLVAGLLCESGSADLLADFQAGLCPGRPRDWVRHQVAIVRALRASSPERAKDLARATIAEHRRQLAEQSDGSFLAADWDDWQDREWLEGLGAAVALSHQDLDLRAWVAEQCRDLPLSVWDAEEDPEAFAAAEQIARHWLLVALAAVPLRSEFGSPVEGSAVCALAEAVWEHCRFGRQHVDRSPEASVVAELGARYAMQYGKADDPWILDRAREGVGPRALRVLLDERRFRKLPLIEGRSDYDDLIVADLVRIASDRFEDGGPCDLETLQHWGRLWLSVGAVDQAERTAMALASFPTRTAGRSDRILVLKLFGLVVRRREPHPGTAQYVASLYNQLWPVFGETPMRERADREEIERALVGSDLIPR